MNDFPCLHVNHDGAPIKYRGICTTDGSYVYGNAVAENYVIQFDYPRPTLYIECKPRSIGLLRGMDKNYEEVYTGDTLIYEEDGTEFKAGALTTCTELYKLKKTGGDNHDNRNAGRAQARSQSQVSSAHHWLLQDARTQCVYNGDEVY